MANDNPDASTRNTEIREEWNYKRMSNYPVGENSS